MPSTARLLVHVAAERRSNAWPEVSHATQYKPVQVTVSTSPLMREAEYTVLQITTGEGTDVRVPIPASALPQLAACILHATAKAVDDGAIPSLTPDAKRLLDRLLRAPHKNTDGKRQHD